MYHIIAMHSLCTLACPTLSVWSCIQVHGLGLRTETRGFKEAARNQKTKKPKSGRESFGFGRIFGFFGFTLCFLVFGSKNQKNAYVFLVFAVSRSLNRAKTLAIFGFSLKNQKNTCVLLVFAVSRSLNHAKTLAIFGFSSKNQKNTCVLLVFQRGYTMKTKKTHVFFWFFDPKTKKHSAKPKKPKIQSKPKDSLPDFGFLVSGGFAESQNCGKQASKTNGRICRCCNRKKEVSLLRALKCAKTQIILRF